MRKGLIVLIVVIALILGIVGYGVSSYNGLVKEEENVKEAYSNVSTTLKRRADLIPQLVSCVKGYMAHEEKVINSVTEARKSLNSANNIGDLSKANEKLDTAINNLFVVVENYPDLKASENFINLQDEIAGTENRITVARGNYNSTVRKYNTSIKTFPTNVIASMSGFKEYEYFKVNEEAIKVPKIEF